MSESKCGAMVQYCGHDGWFYADIFTVGNVNVVRANGPIDVGPKRLLKKNEPKRVFLTRPAAGATHIIHDFPQRGFWRPDLGVFVVPNSQVKCLKENHDT